MTIKLLKQIASIILMLAGFNALIFTQCQPEMIYYKFKNNVNNTTPNFAIPGHGYEWAIAIGQKFGPNGEYDSCLMGMGGVNDYVNTGWTIDIGTGNWTIGFWVNNLTNSNPTYLFGNVSSTDFRCFYGGAAGNNNILLRGNFQDVKVLNVMPGPTVIHFVYDGSSIKVYKNGVLMNSYARSGVNITCPGPLKIGGFPQHNCLNDGGMLDEFRFYDRALSSGEITQSWNIELNCIMGVENNKTVPEKFTLEQNYPNPFNPSTKIKFGIPASHGLLKVTMLKVYDILGNEVITLLNKNLTPGNYEVEWDGANYPSGTYFYRLESGIFKETRKMILVK